MKVARHKEGRISIRLDVSQKSVIGEAASILGTSLSSFVLSNAVEAATRVIEQQSSIRLSERDWNKFLEIVSSDVEPTEAAKGAAESFRAGQSSCTP